MPRWNPEDLRRRVLEHSVVGYRVSVPLFEKGVIEKQIRPERGGFIFYKVRADEPVPFSTFIKRMRVSEKPMTMKEWRKKFVKGTASFPPIAPDLRERLEAGEKVSHADTVFRDLSDRGCVDIDQNVFCYTFPADDVLISDPEPGQLVEIGAGGWAGVVLGFEDIETAKDVLILIQQFTPVPYLRTPEALLPAAVHDSYALPLTWTFGVDLVKAIEKVGVELPPGKWSENGEDYVLDEPILLSEVEAFCSDPNTWRKLGQEKSIFCVQQAMMLHTLPLVRDEISLRPLPEGTPPFNLMPENIEELSEIEKMGFEHIFYKPEEEE